MLVGWPKCYVGNDTKKIIGSYMHLHAKMPHVSLFSLAI